MTIFVKIKRTLFVLILISSSSSFAATFNFHIINSSDSMVNTITITNGYINVQGSSDDPDCQSKTKQFTSDIKVTKGQEAIVSYDPEYPAKCYYNYPIYARMEIVTVDGKSISPYNCYFPNYAPYVRDPNENINAGTVKITEMSDRFLCEYPDGALKG